MSKWISGNELIEKKGLKDFEFFNDCVAKGLQPHNDLGKPIPPSELFNHAKSVGERVGVDLEIEQIDEGKTDWEGISLPKHDFNARTILSRLCHANYKRQEAEKFGLKPGSKAAASSHDKNEKKKPHWTEKDRRKVEEVAQILYANHPEFNTVKEVATHPDVLEAGGKNYSYGTVHKWVSKVAPKRATDPGIRSKRNLKKR